MNSIPFLVLLTFIMYEFQCAQSTTNIFKPWFMSKSLPSTLKQPTEQENGEHLVIALNEQNPISIKTIEAIPNVNPAQNCREVFCSNSEINVEIDPIGINFGTVYERNPETENSKDVIKKLQEVKVKLYQTLGIDKIKERKTLLKSQIRDGIDSIISNLMSMHSTQPKPVMGIFDSLWPFLSVKSNNNSYIPYTIVKSSINDFFYKEMEKPLLELANNGLLTSTIASIINEEPMPMTDRQTTVVGNDPIVSMTTVINNDLVVSATTVIGNDPIVSTTTENLSTMPLEPQPEGNSLPAADVVAAEYSKPEDNQTHGVNLDPKYTEENQNMTAENKTREPEIITEIPQLTSDKITTPVFKLIVEGQKTLSQQNTEPK